MKKVLKNYKSSIILILSIIVGAIVGLIFKEKTAVLQPFGDLFLNLLLVIVVPLVFLTITTSIGKMETPKRVGKILSTIILVFVITSIVSLLVGFAATHITSLVKKADETAIKSTLTDESEAEEIQEETKDVNYVANTVNAISVNNFNKLLTNENLIAVVIFSVLVGIAINISKEKGKDFLKVLDSANNVVQNYIKVIMYYAPIGLGCYFAALIGTFGSNLAIGYAKTFIIYTITAILFYFVVYSLYAFIAAGKKGFINYWKNIVPTTVTALATCSSAASIPVNIECTKKIGVPEDIANTTVPLGTSFHKDGSIIGSVFKIMFLVCLFNSPASPIKILGIAFFATLLIAAVPIGGGTISEMLIITSLGFPVTTLPFLTVIATIIDAPATVLNVVGDSASSMLVARITDGKNWLKSK